MDVKKGPYQKGSFFLGVPLRHYISTERTLIRYSNDRIRE